MPNAIHSKSGKIARKLEEDQGEKIRLQKESQDLQKEVNKLAQDKESLQVKMQDKDGQMKSVMDSMKEREMELKRIKEEVLTENRNAAAMKKTLEKLTREKEKTDRDLHQQLNKAKGVNASQAADMETTCKYRKEAEDCERMWAGQVKQVTDELEQALDELKQKKKVR